MCALMRQAATGCVADVPNKSDALVTVMIKMYVNSSETGVHVCLEGTRLHAGDIDGIWDQADGSSSQDGLMMQTDAPSMANSAETAVMDHGDGTSTHLSAGGMKRGIVGKMDGVESHADASSRHSSMPSVDMNMNRTAIGWKTSEHAERSRNHQTYLIVMQDRLQTSQMAWGTTRSRLVVVIAYACMLWRWPQNSLSLSCMLWWWPWHWLSSSSSSYMCAAVVAMALIVVMDVHAL